MSKKMRLSEIAKNEFVKVFSLDMEEEGKKSNWTYLQPHKHSVLVAPITDDNKILLVKHYRMPQQKSFWEFPGGAVENNETALQAGKRELLEETGYVSPSFETLFYGYDRASVLNSPLVFYVATNCEAMKAPLPEKHILDYKKFSLAEVRDLREPKMCWIDFFTGMLERAEAYKKLL